MKTLVYAAIFAAALIAAGNNGHAQNANTTLSNLTGPTKVNVALLPGNNNIRDIGSAGKQWRNIYAGSAYFLNGTKFINSAGSANTFIGSDAGRSNAGGANNTATGYQALYANQSGSDNTVTGFRSMYTNVSGYINTAYGDFTLYHNTAGAYNAASGYSALYSNTTGKSNTATGYSSLYANTTGSWNTATGINALKVSNGDENSAFGVNALASNTTGIQNTGIGNGSMYYNTFGAFNTGMGYAALYNTTGSQYNTAMGYNAGNTYNNGWNNVFIGANTDVNGANYYNVIAIGQGTICTGVSQARIGNSSTVSIGGYANWTNISDVRVKKNIKENVPGLDFINKLKPITYNLDLDAANKLTQAPVATDNSGRLIPVSKQEQDARKAKEHILYTGFAAQEVEKAAKELNYNFSGVDVAKNDIDLYGLRYAEFVVPLVKAVQELSRQNEAMKEEITKLKTAVNMQSSAAIAGVVIGNASLEQNMPNPFNRTTSIRYTLPQKFTSAQIVIADMLGKNIKQINLNVTGKGSLQVDASMLAAGTYSYSLIIDAKRISTKQMVLTK
ncbi:hypothetical protein BH10BAC2_BH10BAC2_39900 [soil metagenome]